MSEGAGGFLAQSFFPNQFVPLVIGCGTGGVLGYILTEKHSISRIQPTKLTLLSIIEEWLNKPAEDAILNLIGAILGTFGIVFLILCTINISAVSNWENWEMTAILLISALICFYVYFNFERIERRLSEKVGLILCGILNLVLVIYFGGNDTSWDFQSERLYKIMLTGYAFGCWLPFVFFLLQKVSPDDYT